MVNAKSGLFGPSRLLTNSRRTGQRQYAAARVTRLTGDWYPVDQNVNDIIRTSSGALRRRIRQLVRDFPYFGRAVNVLVNFTVGSGMNFQSKVRNLDWAPGSGQPRTDRRACQAIEDAVAWWMDEADASGRLHFCEMERLAKREDIEAGEYLFIHRVIKDSRRYTPFALQAVEADWLTDLGAVPQGNNLVDQGIEYDRSTGAVVAYHITDPDGWGKTVRIPAERVRHGFATLRAGQLRGVSPFAAGVLLAHDLGDFLDATLDTAKLAAKYLALVTTNDPGGFQAARSVPGVGEDADKKIETLENAIIEYLRPGEDVKFATHDNPGQTFQPFTQFILRMLAIATDTSYTLLTGDYSGTNYTTLRGERQDLRTMFKPHHQRQILHFNAPIVREAIDWAVLTGRLDLPGYWKNPRHYHRCVWIPPGQEPIDPLKDSKANRDDVSAGLTSPQRIAARRGEDIEEVLDDLQEFWQLAEERGLSLETGSTALANNPAALEGADERRLAGLIRRTVEDVLDRRELLKEE